LPGIFESPLSIGYSKKNQKVSAFAGSLLQRFARRRHGEIAIRQHHLSTRRILSCAPPN
jgi:hypothetical protein